MGFALLCTTSNDEMTKQQKRFTLEIFVILKYIDRIQIVQKTAQLSSKGRFN